VRNGPVPRLAALRGRRVKLASNKPRTFVVLATTGAICVVITRSSRIRLTRSL